MTELSKGRPRRIFRRMNWGQYRMERSSVIRAIEKREVREEVAAERFPGDEPVSKFLDEAGHVYEGERCVFCHINVFDASIYGSRDCVPRPSLVHTAGDPLPEDYY